MYENFISNDEQDIKGKALQDAFWWMKYKGCVREMFVYQPIILETYPPGPRRERRVIFTFSASYALNLRFIFIKIYCAS
jgi:hypothetical protein